MRCIWEMYGFLVCWVVTTQNFSNPTGDGRHTAAKTLARVKLQQMYQLYLCNEASVDRPAISAKRELRDIECSGSK